MLPAIFVGGEGEEGERRGRGEGEEGERRGEEGGDIHVVSRI